MLFWIRKISTIKPFYLKSPLRQKWLLLLAPAAAEKTKKQVRYWRVVKISLDHATEPEVGRLGGGPVVSMVGYGGEGRGFESPWFP